MRAVVILLSAWSVTAAGQGPISKFDARTPVADYRSTAKLEDIERCLLDMDNQPIPNVYRQPDRPDDVRIVWVGDVKTLARVDLHREVSGTHIRSWMGAKQALNCAPK